MFDADSRYASLAPYVVTDALGQPVTIKKIRVIPETPAQLAHRVTQPDRPDLLAHQYYKAAHLSWRIADANQVMDPATLVAEPGVLIKIPPRT
jgi:hypothetical protein